MTPSYRGFCVSFPVFPGFVRIARWLQPLDATGELLTGELLTHELMLLVCALDGRRTAAGAYFGN